MEIIKEIGEELDSLRRSVYGKKKLFGVKLLWKLSLKRVELMIELKGDLQRMCRILLSYEYGL